MSQDAQRADATPLDVARQAELLELTQDAILVRDLRTSAVTYWNRGAERLYGWSRAEATGRVTHSLLETRFPESLDALNEAIIAAGYWEGELVHSRKDRSQVIVSSRQAVQRDPRGEPIAILEINTDVTERKQAEQEHIRLISEQRARQLAERALDRLSRLQRVTAGLAEALTPHEVASVVVDQGIAALDARAGRIVLVRGDSDEREIIAFSGYARVTQRFGADEPLPTNEVVRTGQPLFLASHAELVARFPRFAAIADPVVEGALACIPLVVDAHVLGALTLAFTGDRAFEEDDRGLLIALATQCAQALERARLYDLSLSIQEDLRHSRDQLAAILDGIAEGVTVQDMHGRLIFANDVAAGMSGFSSVEEFTQAFPDVLHRFVLYDEGGNVFPYDRLPGRQLLGGGKPEEVVVQFRDRESGEWRWSILEAAPVLDGQGHLQMVVNIFRDITDRKRQTDAIAFLAAASTILSSTQDVVSRLQSVANLAAARIADWCIVDLSEADKRLRRVAVAHANPADLELAQIIRQQHPDLDPRPAMKPRSWIVLPLLARGRMLGNLSLATAESGRRYDQNDFEIARDLATRVALAIDGANLFREAQEQAEHHAVLNAALRETVVERDRALADLQQAIKTRDEFLASASHDLKNPLATIKATAQLLKRRLDRADPDLERVREGLARLDAIATRAAGLVDELLDLASMQMGRPLDLDRQSADLVALAREVVEEHQHATERHTIRVEGTDQPLIGLWDGRRLGRVLANLLDNAVKYSPDGGSIDVRLLRDGEWVAIEVIDYGIGIPDDDQPRIFDRFQRASNVERRIVGTGLGLASARHILDSHGGTISVHSQEGRGTTFTVRLPVSLE